MTTDISRGHGRPSKLKKTLFALVLGGAVGFFGAMGFMKAGDNGLLGSLGASEEIAALVGILYILTGVAIGIGLVSPKAGAAYLNVEDAEEIDEQRAMLTYSTLSMIALGVALAVAALAAPTGIVAPGIVVAVFAVAIVLAVVLSLRSRRYQDELMRAMGRESAALAFYLLALVGGIWALASHLDYSEPPAPLDWLTMIWAFMLIAAFAVVAKHGMMKMR